jgi:hypothetical protein
MLNAEAVQLQKLTKPIQDNADVLEQIRTINELSKNPNAYDQKNMAVLQARIAEGKGQRLLQSVIQQFGSRDETAPGWAVKMLNKATGGAAASITPEEMRQLTEHTQKMGGEYVSRFQDSLDQFDQMAPTIATRTMQVAPSRLQTIRDAAARRGQNIIGSLNQEKAGYQNTAAQAGRSVPAPAPPQEQGIAAWLGGKLGLGASQQPSQGAAQSAPAQNGIPSSDAIAAEIARRRAAQGQ